MAWLLYQQVLRISFPPLVANALTMALLCFSFILFAVRRDPVRKGDRFDAFLALVGTFTMSFLPFARYSHLGITMLQIGGSILWLWALLHLGRSFGLGPADRGLKTHGPYNFIRHPIYAGELLVSLGAVLAVANLDAVIVLGIWWLFQVLRIIKEEKVLGGYDEYCRRVRWRILPGVW